MKRRLSGTLTIRLPATVLRRLQRHAASVGETPSSVVRRLLDAEVGDEHVRKTALELSKRWVGVVARGRVIPGRSLRTELERWKPDRRG